MNLVEVDYLIVLDALKQLSGGDARSVGQSAEDTKFHRGAVIFLDLFLVKIASMGTDVDAAVEIIRSDDNEIEVHTAS